jgi:hypothetical protein
MAEADIQAFKAEIELVEQYAGLLNLGDIFLAGVLRARTPHPLANIMKSLAVLRETSIEEETLYSVLLMFYQGKITKAQHTLRQLNLLTDLRGVPKSASQGEVGQLRDRSRELLFDGTYQPSGDAVALKRDLQKAELLKRERRRLKAERLAKFLEDKAEEYTVFVPPDPPCAICLDSIKEADFMPLESCGHLLHPSCVHEYMTLQVLDRKFPIRCPILECRVEIDIIDLQERLDPATYHKFEEFSFNSFVQTHPLDVTCCPTPDCKFVFSWSEESPHFVCPVCEKHYCMACRCEYHDGATCAEHRSLTDTATLDKQFEQYVKGTDFKSCPQCKHWVEKVDGCNHMSCICGEEFCYGCGRTECNCEDED